MKRVARFTIRLGSGLAMAALLLAVLGAAALVTVPRLLGLDAVIVLTGSMEPALNVGGMAFVEPLPEARTLGDGDVTVTSPPGIERIVAGDIITYRSPRNPRQQISHRVIEVIDGGDGLLFRTQGDANNSPDRELVPAEDVVGTVRYHLPYLGYVADRMRHRESFYLLVGIPAGLVIVGELASIYRELRKWRGGRNEGTHRGLGELAADPEEPVS